jgi:hypothetical protein
MTCLTFMYFRRASSKRNTSGPLIKAVDLSTEVIAASIFPPQFFHTGL